MANYDKDASRAGYGVNSGSLVTMFAADGDDGADLAATGNWIALSTATDVNDAVATAALQGTSVTNAKQKNATINFTNVDLSILDDLTLAYQTVEATENDFKNEDGHTEKYTSGGDAAAGYYVLSVYYGSEVTSKGRLLIAQHGYVGGDDTMDFAADTQTTNPFSILPVKVTTDTTIPLALISGNLVTTAADIVIPSGAASVAVWM